MPSSRLTSDKARATRHPSVSTCLARHRKRASQHRATSAAQGVQSSHSPTLSPWMTPSGNTQAARNAGRSNRGRHRVRGLRDGQNCLHDAQPRPHHGSRREGRWRSFVKLDPAPSPVVKKPCSAPSASPVQALHHRACALSRPREDTYTLECMNGHRHPLERTVGGPLRPAGRARDAARPAAERRNAAAGAAFSSSRLSFIRAGPARPARRHPSGLVGAKSFGDALRHAHFAGPWPSIRRAVMLPTASQLQRAPYPTPNASPDQTASSTGK